MEVAVELRFRPQGPLTAARIQWCGVALACGSRSRASFSNGSGVRVRECGRTLGVGMGEDETLGGAVRVRETRGCE